MTDFKVGDLVSHYVLPNVVERVSHIGVLEGVGNAASVWTRSLNAEGHLSIGMDTHDSPDTYTLVRRDSPAPVGSTPEDQVVMAKAESQRRKDAPLFSGCVAYFPDALMEVARLSKQSNEKHNPGQPMHWSFGKSTDHQDCVLRHMVDFDEIDDAPGGSELLHATAEAWRALANLQTLLEKRDEKLHARRQAQRERAAKGER